MDEEEAVKNVTRKAKKIKSKSKKGEKNGNGSMGLDEGHKINKLDAIEHVRVSGKVEIAEMKRDCKKDKAIEVSEADIVNGTGEGDLTVSYSEEDSGDAMDNVKRKKKKKKREKNKTSSAKEVEGNGNSKMVDEESIFEVKFTEDANKEGKKQKVKRICQDENFDKEGEKKKHTQLMENGSDDLPGNEVEYEKKAKKKKRKSVEIDSNGATPINKSNKKVRFSEQDELFLIPGDSNMETGEENLVRGKRFTPEEDEIVKVAVFDYIERHDLGEEGLNMVLNCKRHSKLRGCWKEIASALPHRPYVPVYQRAQILFRRSENRKWTQEEYDAVIKYQQEHGNRWKMLADELGKHYIHVNAAWCRIKLRNRKQGHWSQDEYQRLFNLVNIDLQSRLSEQKRSRHGMLRDNVGWTAISDELSTRSQASCCLKWYKQLTSRMVAQGEWADTDDYRLINGLYSLDATCMEDVDWDGLVEDRTGDVCRKRWNQMVLHIGKHVHKSFGEQVEVLAQRYCPHLLEAREAWDSKPRVP